MPPDSLFVHTPPAAGGVSVSIAVECAHCGKQLKVKDELAGKKGKCPQCQKLIQIPAATAVTVGAGQGGAKTATRSAPAASQSDSAVDIADSSANVAVKPAASPTPASTQLKSTRFLDEQYREQVLASFSGQMTPPKVGIGRRLGAFIVLLII